MFDMKKKKKKNSSRKRGNLSELASSVSIISASGLSYTTTERWGEEMSMGKQTQHNS